MRVIIMFLSFAFLSMLNAQENKTIAKIVYEQTLDYGDMVFDKEFILLFDKNASFYERVEEEEENSEKKIEEPDDLKNPGSRTTIIAVSAPKKGLKSFFYNNSNTDFYYQSIHNGEYILLTKEEGNKIDWKIQEEFKNIGGFKCQKATGFFRGREYTAWFTSEISVAFGPWKLHGTPGLILEAYDADRMIYVVAKSISKNSDVELSDKIKNIDFTKAISMSEKDIKEKEFRQEQLAKIMAQLPKGTKPFKIDTDCKDCPKPLEIFD